MKEYNFYYDKKSISKENFLNGINANEKNWKRKCVKDNYGNYSYGYYKAYER